MATLCDSSSAVCARSRAPAPTFRRSASTMDPTVAAFRLTGLCAANFQAFDAAGECDHAAVPLHAANLAKQGVGSVFTCGTTGESLKLSVAERKAALEAWVAAAKGSALVVVAHVGAESLRDAQELAAHAARAGASAIGIVPPTFFKMGDIDSCLGWVEAVAAHAPALPAYYYHIPSMTGVAVRCDKMLERVAQLQEKEGRLRSFRGIKYSDADLHIYANCVAACGGRFDVLYGKDEQALGALAMGAKGFIGSTYNYVGRTANAMIAAFARADSAAALAEQRKLQRAVNLLFEGARYGPGNCNVGKAILELVLGGKGCGAPRLPGAPVADIARLRADLEELGCVL